MTGNVYSTLKTWKRTDVLPKGLHFDKIGRQSRIPVPGLLDKNNTFSHTIFIAFSQNL